MLPWTLRVVGCVILMLAFAVHIPVAILVFVGVPLFIDGLVMLYKTGNEGE